MRRLLWHAIKVDPASFLNVDVYFPGFMISLIDALFENNHGLAATQDLYSEHDLTTITNIFESVNTRIRFIKKHNCSSRTANNCSRLAHPASINIQLDIIFNENGTNAADMREDELIRAVKRSFRIIGVSMEDKGIELTFFEFFFLRHTAPTTINFEFT